MQSNNNIFLSLKERKIYLFSLLIIVMFLILTGCSVQYNLNSYSIQLSNKFKEKFKVNDYGIGKITANTVMTQSALTRSLNNHYRLRAGMEIRNGKVIVLYQAVIKDQVKLTIYGSALGRVTSVIVTDSTVESIWGVRIGMSFDSVYKQAYNNCNKGTRDDHNAVICKAPQSDHVSYVFKGIWQGPVSLIPPDDQLRNWRVSKIIWCASNI